MYEMEKWEEFELEREEPFEKRQGVTNVHFVDGLTQVVVLVPDDYRRRLQVFETLGKTGISFFLTKLHPDSVHFVVSNWMGKRVVQALKHSLNLTAQLTENCAMVSVISSAMRDLPGVMARIAEGMCEKGIKLLETGDSHGSVMMLVRQQDAEVAVDVIRKKFNLHRTPLRIVVQKFGGTSVYGQKNLLSCVQRVEDAINQGYAPVVVASAPGRKGQPYATDTLKDLPKSEIGKDVELQLRELDLLMTCGEIISISLMAHAIKTKIKRDAVALTGGQAGIYTDNEFGNARILRMDSSYLFRLLKDRTIPVVAGFQGVTHPKESVMGYHGAITTLGRGGSDTTAGALAAALGAEKCEIYTDVEGVMTADPRIIVERARVLSEITYEEAAEMAHLGAKVVHPRCVEICAEYRIPLWVKKYNSQARGTRIANSISDYPIALQRIMGVTNSKQVTHMRVHVSEEQNLDEMEMEVYRSLGANGVSIHLNTRSHNAFEFVVREDDTDKALSVLKDSRVYVRRRKGQVEVNGNRMIVSVVGANIRELPSVMALAMDALIDNGVPILQTADSNHSISFLVSEEHANTAVIALHDKFELHKPEDQRVWAT